MRERLANLIIICDIPYPTVYHILPDKHVMLDQSLLYVIYVVGASSTIGHPIHNALSDMCGIIYGE